MLGFLFIIATFVQYYVFILQVDSFLYEIHIIVSEVAMLGFLFIIATFVQYYVFKVTFLSIIPIKIAAMKIQILSDHL
jgi:hypothetical protein